MKTKKLINILSILTILILPLTLLSENLINENPEPIELPEDQKQIKNLNTLFLNEKDIQKMEGIKLHVNKNLSLLKNLQISLNSKIIPLHGTSIVQLELHPMHYTKIYLPKDSEIIYFKSAVPMKDITFKYNLATIRPNTDLIESSLDLRFKNGDQLYDVSIIASKYDVSKANAGDNLFYPKIILSLDKPLSPIDVIKTYRQSYGSLPKEKLTDIEHNNIAYKIEYSDFKYASPVNKNNVEILYFNDYGQPKNFKYRVTVGSKE